MYLVTATIDSDTGLDQDRVSNSFAIAAFGKLSAENEADLAEQVAGFYNEVPAGQTFPIARLLSPTLSNAAGGLVCRVYYVNGTEQMHGAPHGSPVYEEAFTLQSHGTAATALPSEVAIAVTLEGAGRSTAAVETSGGDRPRQRRTGKLYVGPLNTSALVIDNGVARPDTTACSMLRSAVKDLHEDLQVIADVDGLAVWSRSDGVAFVLEAVSTDNAFDTQRRRGEAPTLRTRLAV